MGGGTYRGVRGDRQGGEGDRIIRWEDNIENLTLGKEPNSPLDYDPLLEHHHPIISTLGQLEGRLYRKICITYNLIFVILQRLVTYHLFNPF